MCIVGFNSRLLRYFLYICELKYVLSNRMSFSIRNTLFITLLLGMSLASCVSDREYRSLKAD